MFYRCRNAEMYNPSAKIKPSKRIAKVKWHEIKCEKNMEGKILSLRIMQQTKKVWEISKSS